MKRRLESKRGITLVALVITIVILLILAGITIQALTGSELFEKAKLAKERAENAEKLEDETLGEYESEIEKYIEEKGKIPEWMQLIEIAGLNMQNYEDKESALSDVEVLNAIKTNEQALKFLSKNKDLFDIVSTNDTTIDNEMIKIGIVPVMTSSNTPAPFSISASTEAYGEHRAYYAFDKNIEYPMSWHTKGEKTAYLQIDMGQKTSIKSFSMTTQKLISAMPKNFSFEGSNDNENWEIIKTYIGFNDYEVYETTLFILDKIENYRYYRFNISEDNGYNYIAIAEIQFYI